MTTERELLLRNADATILLLRHPAEHALALAAADKLAALRHRLDGEAVAEHRAAADLTQRLDAIEQAVALIASLTIAAARPGYVPLAEVGAMIRELERVAFCGDQCADTDGLAAERDPMRSGGEVGL